MPTCGCSTSLTPEVENNKNLVFPTNFFVETQAAETSVTIQLMDDNATPDDPTDDLSSVRVRHLEYKILQL